MSVPPGESAMRQALRLPPGSGTLERTSRSTIVSYISPERGNPSTSVILRTRPSSLFQFIRMNSSTYRE